MSIDDATLLSQESPQVLRTYFILYDPLVDHPPLAGLQSAKCDVADLHANQAQSREAHGGGHVAHLSVFAFDEGEADPTGRDGIFAKITKKFKSPVPKGFVEQNRHVRKGYLKAKVRFYAEKRRFD